MKWVKENKVYPYEKKNSLILLNAVYRAHVFALQSSDEQHSSGVSVYKSEEKKHPTTTAISLCSVEIVHIL